MLQDPQLTTNLDTERHVNEKNPFFLPNTESYPYFP